MRTVYRVCLAAAAMGALSPVVRATVLSGNYCSVAPIVNFPAGKIAAGNWNDFTGPAGYGATASKTDPFYDDLSVATGTTVSWAVSDGGSQNTNDEVYRPRPPATLGLDIDDGHDQLMAGYLQASKNSATEPWITLHVTGLDVAKFGGTYSVLIYIDGDDDVAGSAGSAAAALYGSPSAYASAPGSPTAIYFGRDNPGVDFSVDNDGSDPASVYKRIVSTDSGNPTAGNYVQFDGLTSSEFFIRLSGVPGVHGVAMNGFQIVPEPATLAFLGLGATLGLLRRRR